MIARRCIVCHHTKPLSYFGAENNMWTCQECFIPSVSNRYFESTFMRSEIVSIEAMLEDLQDVDIKQQVNRIESYNHFLHTLYWKIISNTVKVRAGNKCTMCGKTKNLQTHHVDYNIMGEEYNHIGTKLICLCKPCHSNLHHRYE